ncbi:RNase H family protein [Nocardia carnea]|uniref:RNase H family protein n=1 Tax=Nocardia carnea TaxID=37328 RepID=UPI0012F6D6D5|nr:RNase H family protein [Nocardia carnea]
MIGAAHRGGLAYMCGCGSHHVWPSLPPDSRNVPYCLWCAAPLSSTTSVYCNEDHATRQENAHHRAAAGAQPCSDQDNKGWEHRGTALLWARQHKKTSWIYRCPCALFHIRSSIEIDRLRVRLLPDSATTTYVHGTTPRSAFRSDPGERVWHGTVSAALAVSPTVVATDGSAKAGSIGWSFVASDGRWAMGGGHDRDRPQRLVDHGLMTTYAELRGLLLALNAFDFDRPLVFLLDSAPAITLARRWRAGALTAMPKGYNSAPYRKGQASALTQLAERVHRHEAPLSFTRISAHTGHLLNEAADSLASIGRRYYQRDVPYSKGFNRADGLVQAFLQSPSAEALVSEC